MSYTTHGAEWVDGTFEATSDPRNGDTTTMNGIATTKDEAIAQALSYRNNGWSVSIKQLGAGDRWSVTATYNADLITDPNEQRIPDVQWEVQPHAWEQNILDCSED